MSAAITIEIPPEVAAAVRLPRARLGGQLATELALQLYREGVLDFAPARQLAGLDTAAFRRLLRQRGISRPDAPGNLDAVLAVLKEIHAGKTGPRYTEEEIRAHIAAERAAWED